MKNLAIVALFAAFVAGCAGPNPADIKPIQAVYADRLAGLKIGMTTSEFRQKFPEAYPTGQSGGTTAYELTLKQILRDRRRPVDAHLGLYQPKDIISDQSLWFYFYSDQLVQWGRPQDWPQKPDVIIESRTR
ncbi:hypothetical protein [Pedosphaera parvula]|uniref:Lipoprotein n=1 Tax=Pedosphaera parvula (strain Ellin514) TaxID=320771 RepID=B9XQR7_PEDPL|nr:hypothetical protein [Pedosphaera parvula]EEF57849.1 hypothetical protein Cflav_PD0831 [Pedosphaera parvula Ellin514]